MNGAAVFVVELVKVSHSQRTTALLSLMAFVSLIVIFSFSHHDSGRRECFSFQITAAAPPSLTTVSRYTFREKQEERRVHLKAHR